MTNTLVSFFGYPAFEAYKAAHLKTAHTDGLRGEFDESYAQHVERILKTVGGHGFFESIIEFVEKEWAKNSNAYRGASIGWYFHHPESRKLVPDAFLARHDAICGPMQPLFGGLSELQKSLVG